METDVLKALTGGLGLAGRLMGRGVDEVGKAISKPEDRSDSALSGLYFKPYPSDVALIPHISLFESQSSSRLNVGVLRNLTLASGERELILAVHDLHNGRESAALEHLRESAKRSESKVKLTDVYFLLGALHLQRKEPDEAVRHLKTALMAQQGLGKHLRKWAPSLHYSMPLTRHSSFSLFPDLVGLTVLLGVAQAGNHVKEAVETLEQLLELISHDPMATFFVNLYRYCDGNDFAVFQALQRTLPDSNLQVASIILLGKSCQRLGDTATAKEIFRKTLQRQDMDLTLSLDLRAGLAETFRSEGNARDADAERVQILRADPHYRPIEQRLGLTPPPPEPVAAPPKEPAPAIVEAPAPAKDAPAPAPAPKLEVAADFVRPVSKETVALYDPEGKVSRLSCPQRNIEFDLEKKPVIIGREEGDIVLDGDQAASRAHAKITFEENCYWVEDLGSTNGTWVNRHRIRRKVEIHRGDLIGVGSTHFQVV